ncbi:protein ENL [Protopterus annectens]|uniref:protein ENL n=1 Tax=Protopterus annectens TaxID=7888 RepID=UPI001CFB37A0|nr:protein ENL [Protopterus annectens]
MDNQCTVQVKLELGHRAQLRKKPTAEGFTHDWMVFVRGPEQCDIQHFVEKVVFRLHESFPKPKRVCKEPPYKVEESGYAGFIMYIEVYFKNKEEPKKVCFKYDLFLNLEGNPPVNHLRCEKLTFNNPTKEFLRKLIKAGGVPVMPEGAEAVSRPSPDYPMLPTIPLSAFSDPKKSKPTHGSKDASKESSKISKPHKVTKEHRDRPRKDSESKSSSKDVEREQSKLPKESSRKPTESKPSREEKVPPKAAFKEPKLTLKEPKTEPVSPKSVPQSESKPSSKRPPSAESPKPVIKKLKKSSSKPVKNFPGTSPRTSSSSSYSEKQKIKAKVVVKTEKEKVKPESEVKDIKKPVVPEESNSEDEASVKSESVQSSPSNSSSSSDSSSDSDFEPPQNHGQGPLRTMVKNLRSEESDDDDSSSEDEAIVKANPASRDSRLSLSDSDSDSDSSEDGSPPSQDTPPSQKLSTTNKRSGKGAERRREPKSNKPEKLFQKGREGSAYTEELVDLHRRLMALQERNVLQQIVNLIEETGHFNVTNTTFDFDLFSLDESTVRKLQSYLEAVAT